MLSENGFKKHLKTVQSIREETQYNHTRWRIVVFMYGLRTFEDLKGNSQRGEITDWEFSDKHKDLYPAWKEAETEAWRQEEEREKLE